MICKGTIVPRPTLTIVPRPTLPLSHNGHTVPMPCMVPTGSAGSAHGPRC